MTWQREPQARVSSSSTAIGSPTHFLPPVCACGLAARISSATHNANDRQITVTATCDHLPGNDDVPGSGAIGAPAASSRKRCSEMDVMSQIPQGGKVDLWGRQIIGANEVIGLNINADTVMRNPTELSIGDVFVLDITDDNDETKTIAKLLGVVVAKTFDQEMLVSTIRYRLLEYPPRPPQVRWEYNKLEIAPSTKVRVSVVAESRHTMGNPDEWARNAMNANKPGQEITC